MRHHRGISLLVALAAAALALAAPQGAPAQNPDEVAVRAVTSGFVAAWNRHDIEAFARLFADDADFVNVIGLWWRGREEIKKAHEALHATRMKNSVLEELDAVVRFPRPDVAVVHQRWELTGDTGLDGITLPPRRGILTFVLERTGPEWLIISSQNTDIVPLPNVPAP
jgi:uncharacterized protein (TIGR02246 family)